MADFSSETTGARRQNTEGKKKSVNQDSISSKAMLQKWEKLKTVPDKGRLREVITRRSSLQEISKGIFQTVVKGVTGEYLGSIWEEKRQG